MGLEGNIPRQSKNKNISLHKVHKKYTYIPTHNTHTHTADP